MKHIFLITTFGIATIANAQKQGQEWIDSVLTELPKMKNDTIKAITYGKISGAYYHLGKLNEGIAILEDGLKLAEQLKFKRGIANANNNIGLFYSDLGDNKKAIPYLEKGLEINKQIGAQQNIINGILNIGRCYQHESDYENAIQSFTEAMNLAEKIGDYEKKSLVGTNIANAFFSQRDFAKVIEYAQQVVKDADRSKKDLILDDTLRFYSNKGRGLEFIGDAYLELQDTAKARQYLTQSFEVYKKGGEIRGILSASSSLAGLMEPKAALASRLKLQEQIDEDEMHAFIYVDNMAEIGKIYFDLAMVKNEPKKKYYLDEAAAYMQKVLKKTKEIESIDAEAQISAHLSKVEEARGNFKEAYSLKSFATRINDSIYSQESKNKIAAIENKKAIDIKNKEIALNKLSISNHRKTQIGLIAGLSFLGIIGGLLYWQSRTRKKTNTTLLKLNTELDEANKVKARFFGILSHDLRGPIANLVNFLHLQSDSPELLTAEQINTHQKKISSSAGALLQTMESMLLWSKEQMQLFKPEMKLVPVQNLFTHLQQFFAGAENINFSYECKDGLQVSTDENYLQTIMHNLTSNAVKALQKTPNASIEWKAVQEGDNIKLTITDNGPGVSADQVSALTNDGVAVNLKTGFGLHIVRDLAKAIAVTIAMKPMAAGGTSFVITA